MKYFQIGTFKNFLFRFVNIGPYGGKSSKLCSYKCLFAVLKQHVKVIIGAPVSKLDSNLKTDYSGEKQNEIRTLGHQMRNILGTCSFDILVHNVIFGVIRCTSDLLVILTFQYRNYCRTTSRHLKSSPIFGRKQLKPCDSKE